MTASGPPRGSTTSQPVPETGIRTWQESLSEAIRTTEELCELLQLAPEQLQLSPAAGDAFPLFVPRDYCQRMRKGDPRDPLLLQVLPLTPELETVPGYTLDAVGDEQARQQPGLLGKYVGRVLLILTGACAIHCRYCFRKHYPYQQEPHRLSDWEPAFAAIETDPTIHEVILSGGDPLMVTDSRLADVIERLAQIPHLTRLRIHSRLPIVLPNRVTDELIGTLTSTRLTPFMVVHANHPQEIQGNCLAALRSLVRGGISTLNQAVLLRGINDTLETLRDLSLRLIDLGVIPYYLHQLDRVTGTHHFEVPIAHGRELVAQLRTLLPGYAIPEFVTEVPGAPHKIPL